MHAFSQDHNRLSALCVLMIKIALSTIVCTYISGVDPGLREGGCGLKTIFISGVEYGGGVPLP